MRWFAYISFIIVLASCKALKPVGKQASNEMQPQQRATSPQFIENITINTAARRKNDAVAPPVEKQSIRNVKNNTEAGNSIEGLTALQFKYALLMDVSVEALDNLKLLQYIDEWYGTRYHFGGNSKSGIDCSAFSGGLMTTVFGVGLPRMAKDQYTASQRVARDQLQEGDLVFFHTTRKGVSHVGVYLTNNKFVHASLNNGVTISDLNDPYYSRTFVGGGRTVISGSVIGGSVNR
jgi:cell wall-associated NlpC family hydrolase